MDRDRFFTFNRLTGFDFKLSFGRPSVKRRRGFIGGGRFCGKLRRAFVDDDEDDGSTVPDVVESDSGLFVVSIAASGIEVCVGKAEDVLATFPAFKTSLEFEVPGFSVEEDEEPDDCGGGGGGGGGGKAIAAAEDGRFWPKAMFGFVSPRLIKREFKSRNSAFTEGGLLSIICGICSIGTRKHSLNFRSPGTTEAIESSIELNTQAYDSKNCDD